jgi:sugar diacid utilization regulator
VSAADFAAPVTSVVMAALGEDTERLVEAAEAELHRPLGLVSRDGLPLGWAPDDAAGRRALAVAEAAARADLVSPPGWQIVPIERGSRRLGFLAVGTAAGGDGRPLLELVTGLVAEHIERRELARAHRADLVRRLVHEPGAAVAPLRRQAAELGLTLADAYWPAVLAWRHVPPRPDAVARIARHDGMPAGALAVGVGGRLVLLHPGAVAATEPPGWFTHTVMHARRLSPASGAQAIVAERPAALEELSVAVAELEELWRLGPRVDDEPLRCASQFALDRLLSSVAAGLEARAFVSAQLGPLVAWDDAHGSGLLRVLEAALDLPRHEQAAARCFMHRNTFRHRLRQATDILGCDLEDPDVRLAVHVALRLRRVLAAGVV